jgi:hypothetical protein
VRVRLDPLALGFWLEEVRKKLSLLLIGCCLDGNALLSMYATDPAPWLAIQANSEQRQPLYLGLTPRDLALNGSGKPIPKIPSLPLIMKVRAEQFLIQIKVVLAERGLVSLNTLTYLELWPVLDDFGQLTWSISRWRTSNSSWCWLNAEWFNFTTSSFSSNIKHRWLSPSFSKSRYTLIFFIHC